MKLLDKGLYYKYSTYLKERYGVRVHRISIDAGFTCPNRDGTLSKTGCIYCDQKGSGSGAYILKRISIEEQIKKGIEFAKKRFKAKKFFVYFQSFTNTYAPIGRLKELYDKAISIPEYKEDIVGIIIGTRPDCISEPVLDLIGSYQEKGLEVWVEYGLQSIHYQTLKRINRGHGLWEVFDAINRTRERGIKITLHTIIGLPGEKEDEIMETAKVISTQDIQGIKIHPLYIVKDTAIEKMYYLGKYSPLSLEEYISLVTKYLTYLRKEIIIQRITGDAKREDLIAPLWILDKIKVLKKIEEYMIENKLYQGKNWPPIAFPFSHKLSE